MSGHGLDELMKKRTILTAVALLAGCALLLPCEVAGQIVQGTVVDDATRTPIPRAQITLLNDSARVLTTRVADSAGVFEMPVPRDDSVRLKIESVGFAPLETTRFAVGRGQLLNVEVRMSARAIAIEPMVVVARNPAPARLQEFYRRAEFNKKLGQGRIWMREDLEHELARTVRPLLASVPVRPAVGCSGRKMLLDDLPIEPYELDMISVDELEGIEIYRDAFEVPTEYAPLCSLVLLWRKPYDENARPITWRRLLVAAGLGALLLILIAR